MIKKNHTKHNLKQRRKQGLIGLIIIAAIFAIFFLILNQFGPYKGISRLEYNMIIKTIKEAGEDYDIDGIKNIIEYEGIFIVMFEKEVTDYELYQETNHISININDHKIVDESCDTSYAFTGTEQFKQRVIDDLITSTGSKWRYAYIYNDDSWECWGSPDEEGFKFTGSLYKQEVSGKWSRYLVNTTYDVATDTYKFDDLLYIPYK